MIGGRWMVRIEAWISATQCDDGKVRDVLLDASCLMNGLFGCEADAVFVAAMVREVRGRLVVILVVKVQVEVEDLGGFSASEVGVRARKSRPIRQMLMGHNKVLGGAWLGSA